MNIELKSPKEAHYTVYMLRSPEDKVYIGCTGLRLYKRWDCGRGYADGVPVKCAIDRFGWKSFQKTVLCEKLTKEGAEKLEKWFIEYYDCINPEKGYNRFTGGNRKGATVSEESKQKNRETIYAFLDGNTKYSRERQQMAYEYYSQHRKVKEKIAKQMHDFLLTPEGRTFPKSCTKPKPVRCVETGEIFRSAHAAERITGFGSIHKVCAGRRKLSGGFHWEYV